MMENIPSWLLVPTAAVLWFLVKDKLAGVKEIDLKLSDKIDKLLEMVYELKAAIKGIDDLTNRISRVEDRLESLEALNREKR